MVYRTTSMGSGNCTVDHTGQAEPGAHAVAVHPEHQYLEAQTQHKAVRASCDEGIPGVIEDLAGNSAVQWGALSEMLSVVIGTHYTADSYCPAHIPTQ